MHKRLAALGIAAGMTAGGLAGATLMTPSVSSAQSATSTTDSSAATTATAAPDPSSHFADVLAPLVADGTLTQAQADAVTAALAADAPPHGEGPGMRGGHGPNLDVVANALGITVDDLRADLDAGQTIADVATAHGVDVQTVIDAIVADVQDHVAAEVANGDKTQDEADQILADAGQHATDMVNGTRPARPDAPPTTTN